MNKEQEILGLIEASQMLVGLHMELFNSYMKMTDNDTELSLRLSKDALTAALNMNFNKEN